MVIRRQVSTDFDVDTLVNGAPLDEATFGSLLSPFKIDIIEGTHTVGEENDGNKYWHVVTNPKQNGIVIKDASADNLLNSATWKVSMRVKFSNDTDSARFIVWRGADNKERSMLAYQTGKLVFGKNVALSNKQCVVLAEGETIKKTVGDETVYQWVNVAVEMDPVNRTYKVYIEDELVLYTNTANEIYLVNDGVATLYEDWESSDKTPFAGGSTVRELYLFHWSPVDMCIDDFKIEIMDYLPASAE
jgi:hypothetical protein